MSSSGDELPPIIDTPGTTSIDSSGSFTVGSSACFFFTFNDLSGALYDPFDMGVVVTDEDGDTLVESDSLDKIELGKWAYVFTIPSTTTPGKFTLTLTYEVETIDGTETETFVQEFMIVESGPGTITLRQVASRAFLEALIGYTQRIPIWHETVRFNRARTVGKLSFPRWNQSAGADVFMNGELIESGYSIDYWKGRITFSNPIGAFDEVWVSYNFRWLTEEELDSFIEQGINEVNIYPPQTTYTVATIEDRWLIVGLYAAAVNVIRRWLMDIQFAEPPKIFGSLQRAQEVFANLESLKKNYEDDKNKLLEQKKYGPYVGLTKTVTVPEYTLPGGRSRWFRYLFKGA